MENNPDITDTMQRDVVRVFATPNQVDRAKRMFESAISQIGKIKRGERLKQVYTWEELPIESYNYWVTISKDSV
tara:strand:+ start:55 stop:276 length:222 start_codon:yes stop_codon:yes gene_type:complete